MPAALCSTVGVSILNCDFVNIKQEVAELIQSGIDFVHLDVMDGNFVDDITFGPSFIKRLIDCFPNQKFEVHMMVKYPEKFIQPMANAGIEQYIFHFEVTKDNEHCFDAKYSCEDLIEQIHQHKMLASVAINPTTPVDRIFFCLDKVDSVLVMTVVPGLGGQKFMASMMDKVKTLRTNYPQLEIELDGGVAPTNIEVCGQAGANRIVCGTALLRSIDKSGDVKRMRDALFPGSF